MAVNIPEDWDVYGSLLKGKVDSNTPIRTREAVQSVLNSLERHNFIQYSP